MSIYKYMLLVLSLCCAVPAMADIVVPMTMVDAHGNGVSIGEVVITRSNYGLVFTPNLHGLPPGVHGFHVHENASCAPKEKDGKEVAALGAGGHFDPEHAKAHGTPWGTGHLGDLPSLYVNDAGYANQPVLAPRLKDLKQVRGHALMLHAGGDNYSDHPEMLGGGGARIACGVIE